MHTHLRRSLALGATAIGLVTTAAVAGGAVAGAAPAATRYSFQTLGDHKDPTFNQLLGINDQGQIAGYFGSGASGHPNQGYVIHRPYHQNDFVNENFPGSVQTQVTGINDSSTTVGFYADTAGDNFGFVLKHGIWTVVIDPHTTGTTNQLLGLNNFGVAVGFYTDAKGNSHGYEFNFHTNAFKGIAIPGATSLTATGINAKGDVSGFYTNAAGRTKSFLLTGNNQLHSFSAGSNSTTAFGINNHDEIVGAYVTGSGSTAMTHGFVWTGGHLRTVDDPSGPGATTVNGLNDKGDLVGFYTDSKGNTDGMVARPA